jgi:hypothetical protein
MPPLNHSWIGLIPSPVLVSRSILRQASYRPGWSGDGWRCSSRSTGRCLFLLHFPFQRPAGRRIRISETARAVLMTLSIHGYPYVGVLQRLGKFQAGELAALVSIEDVGLSVFSKHLLQGRHTEIGAMVFDRRQDRTFRLCLYYRHKIQESSTHRDVADVGAPDMAGTGKPYALDSADSFEASGRSPSALFCASVDGSVCLRLRSQAVEGGESSTAHSRAFRETTRRSSA